MAKGQKRSNREAKKPKANKPPKSAVPVSPFAAAQNKGKPAPKRPGQ